MNGPKIGGGVLGFCFGRAKASQAVDVVIYLTGTDLGPSSEYRARTVLKGMFARIGIRISWFNGKPKTADLSEDPVVVQVLVANEPAHKVHADALAYTGVTPREPAA